MPIWRTFGGSSEGISGEITRFPRHCDAVGNIDEPAVPE